jgi:hypothetical protein
MILKICRTCFYEPTPLAVGCAKLSTLFSRDNGLSTTENGKDVMSGFIHDKLNFFVTG